MRLRRALVAFVVACGGAVLLSCSGGSSGGGVIVQNVDMTGQWSATINQSSPPHSTNCTGGMAGSSGNFCALIQVPIQQNGANFSGGDSNPYCGQVFSVSGTSTGSNISGTFVSYDGTFTYHTSFTGTVSGNTAVINVTSLTIDGVTGSCTLAGAYDGAR